ncbi:hypothetical protein F511_44442 [Dorcoceras hygrometricum]|uniref:Uncharacterized protein n=1 Tax=Dorcoceras hygrometricum TaxID=472368 RepID=A0A2Z7CKQ2_9LAMI|nr:hypothetical protein F511_44442 [Dorcoceras hygrometricum]
MTSSQSAGSKSYQQMSREAQEMKRRRRRRFQSQVTVVEADVSYYSRSCRQLPFITGSYQQMRREVKEMKRRRAEESADGLSPAVARYQQIQQMLFALITSRKIQSRATVDPVASFAYPVDMESSRKKADVVESYNPDARFQSQYLKIQQKRKAVVDMDQQRSS